jgi:hypothetical protein
VFRTPPTKRLHNEIAALQNRLAIDQAALDAVRKIRADEDREYATRAAERKRFAQLQQLDDFIAGKITHFVVKEDYRESVEIHEFESFIQARDESRYDKKLRLLSLYGDSKGDLSWRIDRYSDGSGDSWKHGNCWPATSCEDALEKASAWLEARYAEWRKETGHAKFKSASYAACAQKIGLLVPDDVAAHAAEIEKTRRSSTLESATKALREAQSKYEAALAEHGDPQ